MSAEKEAEADKLVKKANKLISPSLFDFRLKPDWENAGPMLDRASMLYKIIGNVEKAIETTIIGNVEKAIETTVRAATAQQKLGSAWHAAKAIETTERAATAQQKIGSAWHAAKHMETCADLCKGKGDTEQVAHFYKLAADFYIECGKNTTGAEALAKGAKAVQADDLDMALEMYIEALDIYETEGREGQGMDIYRTAVAAAIKGKKYHDAVGLQMKLGAACEKSGSVSSQHRAYLGAVVIHLYGCDAKSAWTTFQEAMCVDSFAGCSEAYVADGLFDAYRSGSDDVIKDYVTSKTVFKNLDNQIARLAIKLPIAGKTKKMAKHIDELMGGGGEEEEEEAEEDLL
eukprot:gene2669-17157_t